MKVNKLVLFFSALLCFDSQVNSKPVNQNNWQKDAPGLLRDNTRLREILHLAPRKTIDKKADYHKIQEETTELAKYVLDGLPIDPSSDLGKELTQVQHVKTTSSQNHNVDLKPFIDLKVLGDMQKIRDRLKYLDGLSVDPSSDLGKELAGYGPKNFIKSVSECIKEMYDDKGQLRPEFRISTQNPSQTNMTPFQLAVCSAIEGSELPFLLGDTFYTNQHLKRYHKSERNFNSTIKLPSNNQNVDPRVLNFQSPDISEKQRAFLLRILQNNESKRLALSDHGSNVILPHEVEILPPLSNASLLNENMVALVQNPAGVVADISEEKRNFLSSILYNLQNKLHATNIIPTALSVRFMNYLKNNVAHGFALDSHGSNVISPDDIEILPPSQPHSSTAAALESLILEVDLQQFAQMLPTAVVETTSYPLLAENYGPLRRNSHIKNLGIDNYMNNSEANMLPTNPVTETFPIVSSLAATMTGLVSANPSSAALATSVALENLIPQIDLQRFAQILPTAVTEEVHRLSLTNKENLSNLPLQNQRFVNPQALRGQLPHILKYQTAACYVLLQAIASVPTLNPAMIPAKITALAALKRLAAIEFGMGLGAAGLGTEALNKLHQAITPEVSTTTPEVSTTEQNLVQFGPADNPARHNHENIGANNAHSIAPKSYLINPTYVGGALAVGVVAAAGYGAYKAYQYYKAQSVVPIAKATPSTSPLPKKGKVRRKVEIHTPSHG